MEKIDLYDAYKNNTNKTIIRGEKVPTNLYRYVVSICIFNSKGEMLIQKRTTNKKYWPGLWDVSAAGCVSSGETPQKGASRELFEELGISYDFTNIRPMITYSFEEGYDDIYVIFEDIDLSKCVLQKEEVSKIKYASKEEIKKLIKDGQFISYYDSVIDFIFEMKDKSNLLESF